MHVYRGTPDLGDRRLVKRWRHLQRVASTRPGHSFPQMVRSESEREALYRFLRNSHVSDAPLIAPHLDATCRRMREQPLVLIAHDTTEFSFPGESPRPGLGILPNGQGFLGHFALAIDPAGRVPLGICGVETLFRDTKRGEGEARRRAPDKESLRWHRLAHTVEERAQHPALIHLMDREADTYETLAKLVADHRRFVIRQKHDRVAEVGADNVVSLLARVTAAPAMLEREVRISRRSAKRPAGPRKAHPPRAGRLAHLCVAALTAVLHRPKKRAGQLPQTLTVNVVRVWEPQPPPGDDAIEWYLLTTEAITTPDEVAAVVDYYRARWLIEEYFKALKVGCSFEKRQLENRSSILNALMLFLPIAWKLLLMRALSRLPHEVPASEVLTDLQCQVLAAELGRRLPAHATARDALLAVAQLGGHIKSNGAPGWQVIGRGYQDLLLLERGWCAARGAATSDQS
jgi:hypothetical protein